MKKFLLVLLMVLAAFSSRAMASNPADKIQQMQEDLGATAELQMENNGKVLACKDGGTKTVTVSINADQIEYLGNYNSCREGTSERDGIYKITVRGNEVLTDTESRSINGELFDAATSGDLVKAKNLILRKADLNFTARKLSDDGSYIDGWTTLMSAVVNGHVEMVQLLVASGADVNMKDSNGATGLWLAANSGNLPIVRILVTKGAALNDQNAGGLTSLMIATVGGHYDVVKYLLASKADVNLKHKEGDTALMFALASGRNEIASLIIDAGADLNIQNKYGVTALIIAANENNVEMAGKLLDKKADPNRKIEGGKTALDIASFRGNTLITEMLKKASPAL